MLSIVIPVYNEEESIYELYFNLIEVLNNYDHEIIFIDDGSTDKTFSKINELMKVNLNIFCRSFKINQGKAAALMSGFAMTDGDIIITMDGDLQDDPKEIPKFIEMINEGYDMVSGWKFKRNDPITKTLPSKFFNWLTRKLTKVNIHDSNCGFKAYKKEVVKNLNIYGELHRYIPALVNYKGYKIGEVKVEHHARKFGKSKYGFERLLKGFFDLITVKFIITYMDRPLHFFGKLSFLFGGIGCLIGVYMVYLKILTDTILGKQPLLLLGILLILLSAMFFSLGLISELIIHKKNLEVLQK